MKNPLIEPISYVDEMVVLVSEKEKIKIRKSMSQFIETEKNKKIAKSVLTKK